MSTASGSLKLSAAGGDRVPAAGASPVPPLDTTGRPAEQQRDTGDRARHVSLDLSPKTLVVLVLVAGTLSPAVHWLEGKRVRRGFGIAIVFTVFSILALFVVVLTIPALVSQAEALLESEPALRVRLTDYLAGSPLSAPLATWLRGLKTNALTGAHGGMEFDFSLRVFFMVAYTLSALFFGRSVGTDIESGNANGQARSTTRVDKERGKQ